MARALRLAARGLYTTDPNPRVGCVLVKDGRVVGEGWHERAGGPHAERAALAAAADEARGATAFVTLEPCCHQGRTGPCTSALIEAGVARVVCASLDPNPRIAGAGLQALRRAGIETTAGVLEAAAESINVGYLARHRRGRPWVRSKLAASLDGRTALASGESRWITSRAARADVHRWRARSSAVLTGVGTVLRDDPLLTVRLEGTDRDIRPPLRVVVDSLLRTPPGARLLAAPGDTLIFATAAAPTERRDALVRAGARIETVGGEGRCDPGEILARLAALEINEVWVEAGPALNGALLDAGLIDELIIYVAPHVLGDTARGMFAITPLARLQERAQFTFRSVRSIGDDLRIIARPRSVPSES